MAFNWKQFLDHHSISYVTSGPNTSRNWLGIACPLCKDDPSEHMGVSLQHTGWRCGNKGRRPHKLIQEILKCSYAQAAAIVGDDGLELPSDTGFLSQVQSLFEGPTAREKLASVLTMPNSFRRLKHDSRGLGRLYERYLISRGYSPADLQSLLEIYPLYYTTNSLFSHRIIFPIYNSRFELASWTGRAITKSNIRYKTLSVDPEKAVAEGMPIALAPTTHLLWDYPSLLEGADKLFLVEGPLDGLRVSFYGSDCGIKGTCLFTKVVSEQQLDLLNDIVHLYKHKYLLLDAEVSRIETVGLMNKLGPLGFKRATLPQGVSDPAELSPQQVRQLGG